MNRKIDPVVDFCEVFSEKTCFWRITKIHYRIDFRLFYWFYEDKLKTSYTPMTKPYLFQDKKLQPYERPYFELRSLTIRDNFGTKYLAIAREDIGAFISFLRQKDITSTNRCLIEQLQNVTASMIMNEFPVQGSNVKKVRLLYKQKVYWKDLVNEIEELGCRPLTTLEHFAFNFLFPEPHLHAQVVSCTDGIIHQIPELGQLGMRSFRLSADLQTSLHYTCFLHGCDPRELLPQPIRFFVKTFKKESTYRGEVFKDVFVPITPFNM